MMCDAPFEAYAHATHRLHPTCIAPLTPFFSGAELAIVRVTVLRPWVPQWMQRCGMHAVLVVGTTIYCVPGVLDAEGMVLGNFWSWTVPRGIALWAHEVLHVVQYRANPSQFRRMVATGILASWSQRSWYDHTRFPFEVEAIAFQRQVRATLEQAAL